MTIKKTTYTLLPKQGEFLFGYKLPDDPKKILNDISLYQGGMGSGKTFCGSLRGLTCFALKFAGCRGLVGAKSQDLLDNTTKRKYEEHLENIGLKEGVHWWYTDRKQTMNFINGSVIRFKTLSDWEQFMSEEFTWIEFEEASFLDEIVFIKLITRLRQQKRDEWGDEYIRALFMHTNPQGKRGWLNKHFINPKTRKESYRYITASTRENYHLGDEYVEMLEELYSADQIKEMIEGLDVDYDNTVAFPQFTEFNVKELQYDPNESLILTCDFNYNPMCWYLVQEVNKEWHILRELIYNNVTTKEMCKIIQPIVSEYNTRSITIMGDAHGGDKKTNGSDYDVMLSHFADAGYYIDLRVSRSNPPIKDRLATLRGLLCNAKGVRKVYVDPSCHRLIYNFEECKNHLGNGGLKLPTDSEIQNDDDKRYLIHPIDAISYPMYYLQSLRAVAGDQEKL